MDEPDNKKAAAARWPESTRSLNFYDIDGNLQNFLRRAAPLIYMNRQKDLSAFGAFVADRLDRQATASDQDFPPALHDLPHSHARPQGRRGAVRLNAEYEDCQQEIYRRNMLAPCFDAKKPESHILPFVAQYMLSQADIATGCPFAMTHPVAFVLDKLAPAALKKKYLPEILRTDGKTAICGTWATERHSGSDVGGTVTKAVKQDDGGFRLFGHNWFTSAFGFKKFLAIKTARPEGAPDGSKGLGLYLVPSHIDDDGAVSNNFNITHLKNKLGTRGLPTVEVDLEGTIAHEIAPAGQGLKAMMVALGCSRVHNAMAAAGVMHRAYREALCWAENRETFGQKLSTRPMVQKRIMEIGTQWMAGCALAFAAAESFDLATKNPQNTTWMRIVTALAKYKTAEQAVWCAQKTLSLIGGNGYTEDYPSARQFRDAMVLPVWEGPEQIQALELMRMIAGPEPGDRVFIDQMKHIAVMLPPEMSADRAKLERLTDKMAGAFAQLRAKPALAEQVADDYMHKMADVLTYALLCQEASWDMRFADDCTKLFAARDYYDSAGLETMKKPSFVKGPLHEVFDDIAAGRKVPVRPHTKKPGAKP